MNTQPVNLAQQIKRFRRGLGESQETFGERFGVKRLTVTNWEKGTRPNSHHLPQLTQLLSDEVETKHDDFTYQLSLPFDQTINLELRVTPKKADSVHFEVRLKHKAS